MRIRYFVLFGVAFAGLCCAGLAIAQETGESTTATTGGAGSGGGTTTTKLPAADMYLSPAMLLPSGAVNITPNKTSGGNITNSFPTDLAPVGDTTNYLGCAGIGQSEFTSGLYNMPESFAKFQEDVNSNLARELLAMNFVLPQTAAMFDQLNTFGSQRFQQFQQGCSLDALKQDAKQQYVKACVTKIQPDRLQKIQEALGGGTGPTQANAANQDKFNAMAYAQSWEICSNQYISDTVALEQRKQGVAAFAKKTRELENVTLAIKPLLCKKNESTTSGSNPDGTGCWASFLIPQVRMCFGESLEDGCKGEYGVKEPLVSMPRLLDTLRFIMEDEVLRKRVVSLTKVIDNNSYDPTEDAKQAVISMSAASLRASLNGTSNIGNLSQIEVMPDESIIDFQLNFLSCKDPNILQPVEHYASKIKETLTAKLKSSSGDSSILQQISVTAFAREDYNNFVETNLKLEGDDDDIEAFGGLLQVGLGCTANQSIPIFDPNMMAYMQTHCSLSDIDAFNTMAGYDVAMTATRDIYRYLGLKLKQVYTQLLSNGLVPVSATATASADSTTSPTLSPELNNRLAVAVKETMIPYVEAQVARLNDLNATRGQLGNRVRDIYSSRGGCVGGGR